MKSYAPLELKTANPADAGPDALNDTLDRVLREKPLAVCLYLTSSIDPEPFVDRVLSSGTKLITIGGGACPTNAFAHVRVDLTGAAEELGARLAGLADGKRSYLLLHASGRNPAANSCRERFMQRARAQPQVTLLQQRGSLGNADSDARVIREMFALFPHAGLIVTLDPAVWVAYSPDDLLGGDARFATLGAPPALWQYLRDGRAVALAGPLDGEIGAAAVRMAASAVMETRKPGATTTVSCELVTADNLADFARRYTASSGVSPE